jgi:hypothetical protein
MINLTHMISILNSVFTVVFYVRKRTKLDTAYICFEKIVYQFNLFDICICLYFQQKWDA